MVSTLLLYYVLIFSVMNRIYANNITSVTDNEYENETINCIPNEPCNILCQHSSSCASATINCPTNFPCTIQCSQTSACLSTQINAQYASLFRLLDCTTGTWTCVGMTLFFPPNDHGQKKAFLTGFDRGLSAGNLNENPLQFYAINGWNDIDITPGTGFTFGNHAGSIYCTPNYIHSCVFNSNAWSCANATDICNNPPSASAEPTQNPSRYPTLTRYPTLYPTKYPTVTPILTTSIPTDHPVASTSPPTTKTVAPSNYPITILPTQNPIVYSTETPTKAPLTNVPTRSPIDYKFCKNNGDKGNDNIEGKFIMHYSARVDGEDNLTYEQVCEFCMCNGDDSLSVCATTVSMISSVDEDMIDIFMNICGFKDQCTFEQIDLKTPSKRINRCGCDIFECVPLVGNKGAKIWNIYVFILTTVVCFVFFG